jgi:hypothetical protein
VKCKNAKCKKQNGKTLVKDYIVGVLRDGEMENCQKARNADGKLAIRKLVKSELVRKDKIVCFLYIYWLYVQTIYFFDSCD